MYSNVIFVAVVLQLAASTLVQGIALGPGATRKEAAVSRNAPATAATVNNGHAAQSRSGYEGYSVGPPMAASLQEPTALTSWSAISRFVLKALIRFLSRFVLNHGDEFLASIFRFLLGLGIGAGAKAAICSVLPFCPTSFADPGLAFSKGQSMSDQFEDLATAKYYSSYITPENLKRAAEFLKGALETYSVDQRREVEQPDRLMFNMNENL